MLPTGDRPRPLLLNLLQYVLGDVFLAYVGAGGEGREGDGRDGVCVHTNTPASAPHHSNAKSDSTASEGRAGEGREGREGRGEVEREKGRTSSPVLLRLERDELALAFIPGREQLGGGRGADEAWVGDAGEAHALYT